ncbi:1,3-beta-D-glucan synthase [Cladochytrium tenue]|nr:1,3-beta-D-glucan synthase [Cladochytrium tenue]
MASPSSASSVSEEPEDCSRERLRRSCASAPSPNGESRGHPAAAVDFLDASAFKNTPIDSYTSADPAKNSTVLHANASTNSPETLLAHAAAASSRLAAPSSPTSALSPITNASSTTSTAGEVTSPASFGVNGVVLDLGDDSDRDNEETAAADAASAVSSAARRRAAATAAALRAAQAHDRELERAAAAVWEERSRTVASALAAKLHFQHDAAENAREFFVALLRSRASSSSSLPPVLRVEAALTSLHEDYFCGRTSNFRTWLFGGNEGPSYPAFVDLFFSRHFNPGGPGAGFDSPRTTESSGSAPAANQADEEQDNTESLEERWATAMQHLPLEVKLHQLLLYLAIWVESANLRFVPEFLCFLFSTMVIYDTENGGPVNSPFLENSVIPLYEFLRDQRWEVVDNGARLVLRGRDHFKVIGYDDANEFFQSQDFLSRLYLASGQSLADVPVRAHYTELANVDWKRSLRKTFYEYRTVLHPLTNFSRIWILHVGLFASYAFYALAPLVSKDIATLDRVERNPDLRDSLAASTSTHKPDLAAAATLRVALAGAGGLAAAAVALAAALLEPLFLPFSPRKYARLAAAVFPLLLLLAANAAPLAYLLLFASPRRTSATVAASATPLAQACAALQLAVSVATIATLAIVPPGRVRALCSSACCRCCCCCERRGGSRRRRRDRALANPTFSANFAKLKPSERWLSVGLWGLVFLSKAVESFFFVVMPAGKPIGVFVSVPALQCGPAAITRTLCSAVGMAGATLLALTAAILFLLDTYMWWLVWATILGVLRAFYLGLSILAPGRNLFLRLPERIYSKLLATDSMTFKQRPKVLCAQIWNAVVVTLAQEHLLPAEAMDKLLYACHGPLPTDPADPPVRVDEPKYFSAREDAAAKSAAGALSPEARRRIGFFAQSLSMAIPDPVPVPQMPSFSVLIPHYAEKILLSLHDVVGLPDEHSNVTLLEYLKSLHTTEWRNFVNDARLAAAETAAANRTGGAGGGGGGGGDGAADDAPDPCKNAEADLDSVGFVAADPRSALRTRIWASLRSQTLFRCVSGYAPTLPMRNVCGNWPCRL